MSSKSEDGKDCEMSIDVKDTDSDLETSQSKSDYSSPRKKLLQAKIQAAAMDEEVTRLLIMD
jgi:hypothetical protein